MTANGMAPRSRVSPITPMKPNYPYGGGYSAPLVVQPNGQINVLYIGHPTDPATLTLHRGYEYFTSSRNSSSWPANPLRLWPGKGTLSLPEWWVDGDIAADAGGNVYATWGTQISSGDFCWLTYSTDGGRTWSEPAIQVSSQYGSTSIWPGDTFGIATLPGGPGTRVR